LNKLAEGPKLLSLKTKISNENLEAYVQAKRFVIKDGKCFSFAVAK